MAGQGSPIEKRLACQLSSSLLAGARGALFSSSTCQAALQVLNMWQAKGRLPLEYTLPALQYLANLKIDHDGIQAASRPAQHGAAVAKRLPKCVVPNRLILEPDSRCDVVNSGDQMQTDLDLDQYGTMDTFRWVWTRLPSVLRAAVV